MSRLPENLAKGEVSFEYLRPPNKCRTFKASLLEATEDRIVLSHQVFPSKGPLVVGDEEVIGWGYGSVWFLYKNQPFDVARFYRPDGTWTGYYVDVLEPVLWTDADPRSIQAIVDLFLDLWIAPDGSHQVLDVDEFEEAVEKGWITDEQAGRAKLALHHLVEQTVKGRFPPREIKNFSPVSLT